MFLLKQLLTLLFFALFASTSPVTHAQEHPPIRGEFGALFRLLLIPDRNATMLTEDAMAHTASVIESRLTDMGIEVEAIGHTSTCILADISTATVFDVDDLTVAVNHIGLFEIIDLSGLTSELNGLYGSRITTTAQVKRQNHSPDIVNSGDK